MTLSGSPPADWVRGHSWTELLALCRAEWGPRE